MAAGTWPQPAGPQGTFGETMKTWTRQAGLPLVTATKECSATGCTLTFSQQMLVTAGETDTARVWHLPLNWGPADGLPVAWLQGAGPLTVDDPTLSEESVLLLNTDGFGYYRVLYDEANWRAIAAVLRDDRASVSALSRASVICDVLALERSGHVSADIMVDVLSYIGQVHCMILYILAICTSQMICTAQE
jgi:aminopeptidase N